MIFTLNLETYLQTNRNHVEDVGASRTKGRQEWSKQGFQPRLIFQLGTAGIIHEYLHWQMCFLIGH